MSAYKPELFYGFQMWSKSKVVDISNGFSSFRWLQQKWSEQNMVTKMVLSLSLMLFLGAIRVSCGLSQNILCGSDVQTYVCLQKNYSMMDIPLVDEPNNIGIEIHISDVLKINDRDFSITFSLYFNVKWREPRLQLNPRLFQNRLDTLEDNHHVIMHPLQIYWPPTAASSGSLSYQRSLGTKCLHLQLEDV